MHRRQRRQAEALPDFLEARRVAVLLDEIVQEVQNLALTFGKWQHARDYMQTKSESQRKDADEFTFRSRRWSK